MLIVFVSEGTSPQKKIKFSIAIAENFMMTKRAYTIEEFKAQIMSVWNVLGEIHGNLMNRTGLINHALTTNCMGSKSFERMESHLFLRVQRKFCKERSLLSYKRKAKNFMSSFRKPFL